MLFQAGLRSGGRYSEVTKYMPRGERNPDQSIIAATRTKGESLPFTRLYRC